MSRLRALWVRFRAWADEGRHAWWIGGGIGAVIALLVFALVGGGDGIRQVGSPDRTADPAQAPPSPSLTTGPPVTPVPPPAVNTDGCKGMVTAAQASRASGLPLAAAGGDAASAVTQYGQSVQANVKLCPFGSAAGDLVTVAALTFPDSAQAAQMFESGRSTGTLTPVAGLGDAALTDGSKTLLVRRGRLVVAVYLVAAANPDADHLGVLKALAALAR